MVKEYRERQPMRILAEKKEIMNISWAIVIPIIIL